MTHLERMLSGLVEKAVRQASSEGATPQNHEPLATTLRVPVPLRRTYEALAEALNLSINQTILLTMHAVTEDAADPEALRMATRLQRALHLHGIHAADVGEVHPKLNAWTQADVAALLSVVNREVVEAVGRLLEINPRWLAGEDGRLPRLGGWYSECGAPLSWAKEHLNTVEKIHLIRVEGAEWDRVVPPDDAEDRAREYGLAVIMAATVGQGRLRRTVYPMWGFNDMAYKRARMHARILLSSLDALGLPFRGHTISGDDYWSYLNGHLMPLELIKASHTLPKWQVGNLLYGAGGPYQKEDEWIVRDGERGFRPASP